MTTGLEQVCLSTTVIITLPKKPFILATMRLWDAAVGIAASHLIFAEIKNSQAAIMAFDNTKIKSNTTLDAVLVLNKLGENNQVLIKWIPAHNDYVGNET